MKTIKLFITILVYIGFISIISKHVLADMFHKNSKLSFSKGEYLQAEKSINEAINLNPREPAYLRQKAKVLIAKRPTDSNEKIIVLKTLNDSIELNPINAATLRNNIPLFYFVSIDYNDATLQTHDPNVLSVTQEFYSQLETYFLQDAGALTDIAKFEKRYDQEKYLRTKEKIGNLRPDLLEWQPDLLD